MQVERTAIAGVLILRPAKISDDRGFFSESFKRAALQPFGVDADWLQENHVYSARRGTVRGLHFQRPPFAQAKLVRAVRGAVLDVAVDLRNGSPSYGQHVAVELSAENWTQLYVPPGFAHGYCTLTADAEVLYKVSAGHAPADECGLAWDDPDLAIAWPISAGEAVLSPRDRAWAPFRDFRSPF